MPKFEVAFQLKCPVCDHPRSVNIELDEPNWSIVKKAEQINIYRDLDIYCGTCNHQFLASLFCDYRQCELLIDERPNEKLFADMPYFDHHDPNEFY